MRIPVIDLFAGAGGLSAGAVAAGAEVRLSVEIDPIACRTLRLNATRKHVILETDVASLTGSSLRKAAGLSRSDQVVVLGGPPCQPFSKAAYWTEAGAEAAFRRARSRGEQVVRPPAPVDARPDERRSLVQEFIRLVIESRADAFLFENVLSIEHPRNRPVLQGLLDDATSAGYRLCQFRVNAVEYGIPQRRERLVVLCMKKQVPNRAQPTHAKNAKETSGSLLPPATAGDAIKAYADDCYAEPEEVVVGRWAEHLRTIPPGWNYKAHTAWGGHSSPTFLTETRFWNFLLKLSPDLPSWTLAASPGPWTGPFHWDARRLRTPEMAALQGFPGGYRFAGSRRERVRQIGNAVPPPLAAALIGPVLADLNGRRRAVGRQTQ